MAENGTPSTTAAEPKKTRAKGVNKVGVEINAPKDVNPYLTAFRAKVGGENGDDGKPGRELRKQARPRAQNRCRRIFQERLS
jgi:hypothetical protein